MRTFLQKTLCKKLRFCFTFFLFILLFIQGEAQTATWTELGGVNSLLPYTSGSPILSIASDSSGNIFCVGWFQNSNSNNFVAKWDKSSNQWSELGGLSSLPGAIFPIHVVITGKGGNVFAGGELLSDPYEYYVARWDKLKNTWSELGGNHSLKANGWVRALASDTAGNIYAAGLFGNTSNKHYVAKWDHNTNNWSELGGDNSLKGNNSIYALCIDLDGNIYTAGAFTNSNGYSYVAKWDPLTNSWSELGGTDALKANNDILTLTTDGYGNMYAAGEFTNTSGRNYVAKWDKVTNTWTELGGPNSLQANNSIWSIISVSGNIMAGGDFKNSSGNRYVAKWDKTTNQWSELGGNNSLKANNTIGALTSDPNGEIYTAGVFRNSSLNNYVAHLLPPLAITFLFPNPSCSGSGLEIHGRGFTGTTLVNINGTPVSSFSVVSDTLITAVPVTGTSGVVSVTSPLGTANFNGYTTRTPVTPAISISATSTTICSGSSASFSSTALNEGSNPSYQWQVNGVNTGINSANFTTSSLTDGDIIQCILTSNQTCLSIATATSNAIVVNVIAQVIPGISIKASDTSICEGSPITFIASAINEGTAPVFNWRKNGMAVANGASYAANNWVNGDVITCSLTSNASCAASLTTNSNAIAITVFPKPNLSLDKTNYLCKGSSRTLNAGIFDDYLWNDNSTGRTLLIDTIGTYFVSVIDSNGCSGSDTTHITALTPLPTNFLGKDTSACFLQQIMLKPNSTYKDYLWSDGSSGSALMVSTAGSFWLQVKDANNCIGKDSIIITTKECPKGFYIPTAFSPNGDGKNDVFRPLLFGNVKQYKFTIYNRWGQTVFQTTQLQKGWNGNVGDVLQETNVFVWICTYQLSGETVRTEKGTVLLIK